MSADNIQQIKNEDIGILHSQEPHSEFFLDNDTWLPDKEKSNYHKQRLMQSQCAFWLSFGGSITGFLVIIGTTIFCLATGQIAWIGIVSGGIIEAVAALFFTLSNKTNEKISEFFDKLTLDSNTTHAMHMTKEIKNNITRDQLLVKLSLHLAGINEDKICKNTTEICSQSKPNSINDNISE